MTSTDSHLSVTVLGSGTCTPSTKRGHPANLVHFGSYRYLVDSGSGTIRRLVENGVRPVDLDALFYSHIHVDHVGDLFPILFTLRNAYGQTRKRPLQVHGPPGFCRFFDHLAAVFPDCADNKHFTTHVVEMDSSPLTLPGGLRVQAFPMAHLEPSVGYRFTAPSGQSVAITGDTDVCPGLEQLVAGVDLVVAECSTPDDLKVAGHLSPTPLGEVCEAAGVRAVVLTHLYPPCDEVDVQEAVRRVFHGEVHVAEDGASYAVD